MGRLTADPAFQTLTGRLRLFLLQLGIPCLALICVWPAAAQTVFSDQVFLPGTWALKDFSTPSSKVTATSENDGPTAAGTAYREVVDEVASNVPNAVALGVHIYNARAYSGPITSIAISLNYECPDAPPGFFPGSCSGNGQTFGPALLQGGNYFVAYSKTPASTGSTAPRAVWSGPTASAALSAGDFYQVGNPMVHPDFSGAGAPIECGFYTSNTAGEAAGGVSQAGYSNWACTVTPPPSGLVKICEVAGSGVAAGTPFTFSYSGAGGVSKTVVAAGAGPEGACALGPTVALGANVTVTEDVPPGNSVSGISVAPATRQVGDADTGAGSVTFSGGSGVTELTFTDEARNGYLAICKQPPAGAAAATPSVSSFTVTPGNLAPIAVAAGACSPAIAVPAGQLVIRESTPGEALAECAATPASQQVGCDPTAGTSTVAIVPGDVSTQTVASFTNDVLSQPTGDAAAVAVNGATVRQ